MRSKTPLFVVLAVAAAFSLLVTGCSQKPALSDAQVTVDVQNKIYGDSSIQSRDIRVQAANGVVTLSGNVANESERTAAAGDAATIAGVKTVINNLQVQQAQAAPPAAQAVSPPEPRQSPRREKAAKPSAASTRHHNAAPAAPVTNLADTSTEAANTPPPAVPVVPAPAPAVPQPPPPPQKVMIPAGTQLTVRLNEPLDSERNQVGDSFHGTLGAPLVIGGETAIPSGADVTGRVADVKSAGRFAGNSVLTLELTSISLNGRTYNIQTNQWSRSGKGEGKNTATKVGVGTAAGAVLGGIIGGGRGAAIGAATGAGAGTGVAASKKGEQIKLAPEAVLNFQIINPLTVTPQDSNDRNAGRTPLS